MTSVETLMAILSRYPFAEELRPSDLEKLCAMACEIPFRKNEIIFREGDECNVFYLLTSGKVILEIAVGGRTLGIETLEAGDELGWSSMLMLQRGPCFWLRSVIPAPWGSGAAPSGYADAAGGYLRADGGSGAWDGTIPPGVTRPPHRQSRQAP